MPMTFPPNPRLVPVPLTAEFLQSLPLLTAKALKQDSCGLFGSEEKLVDCSGGVSPWLLRAVIPACIPFLPWLLFLFLLVVLHCPCGHIARCAHTPALDSASPLSTAKPVSRLVLHPSPAASRSQRALARQVAQPSVSGRRRSLTGRRRQFGKSCLDARQGWRSGLLGRV